jgi:hypothetical protein
MGTILNGLDDHEGHAAQKLPDGSFATSWVPAGKFVAYVASCECATGSYSWTTWRGVTEHPPTEDGEQAAIDEWERVHAGPLLVQRRAEMVADAARVAEALRTAGLVDEDDRPKVAAIMGTWWHPDGPYSSERIIAAGLALDELTHYLARATLYPGVLNHGPQLYRLLGELRSGLGRLDQILDQLSERATDLAGDPTLYDDRSTRTRRRDPADTAREIAGSLDAARLALGPLTQALGAAHNASAHLGHNR